eukprot:4934274-Amphidinium_carterae.1
MAMKSYPLCKSDDIAANIDEHEHRNHARSVRSTSIILNCKKAVGSEIEALARYVPAPLGCLLVSRSANATSSRIHSSSGCEIF